MISIDRTYWAQYPHKNDFTIEAVGEAGGSEELVARNSTQKHLVLRKK